MQPRRVRLPFFKGDRNPSFYKSEAPPEGKSLFREHALVMCVLELDGVTAVVSGKVIFHRNKRREVTSSRIYLRTWQSATPGKPLPKWREKPVQGEFFELEDVLLLHMEHKGWDKKAFRKSNREVPPDPPKPETIEVPIPGAPDPQMERMLKGIILQMMEGKFEITIRRI